MRLANQNHPKYKQIVLGGHLERIQVKVTMRACSRHNCRLLLGSLPRVFILARLGCRVSRFARYTLQLVVYWCQTLASATPSRGFVN